MKEPAVKPLEYRVNGFGPLPRLASGRVVMPGEIVPEHGVDLDDPHDRALVDDGLLVPTYPPPADD
jgi:hypothetical protein